MKVLSIKMRRPLFIVLTIVAVIHAARAGEEEMPGVMPAEQLCSELLSGDRVFEKLKGTDVMVHGRLSSIGDKRKAFLGNRINSVVELIITPEPKKGPFGKEARNGGCYISCFINVPGELCEFQDGQYKCRQITSPKLEENLRSILKLADGDSLTIRGELWRKSLLSQYSIGGHKSRMLSVTLSGCEIVEIKKR